MKLLKYVFVVMMFMGTFASAVCQQIGRATYYAKKFHGRRTSSGDIYHKDSFTCAHRTLPFGTVLRVRDKKTGNQVYVKVTDRVRRGATVDLSYAAAKELGILGRGSAQVEISKCEDVVMVPYKSKTTTIPQLQVRDPKGEGYCSLAEWSKRNNEMKKEAALAKASQDKTKGAANDSIPRYKILDQLTAQDNELKTGTNSVVVKQ